MQRIFRQGARQIGRRYISDLNHKGAAGVRVFFRIVLFKQQTISYMKFSIIRPAKIVGFVASLNGFEEFGPALQAMSDAIARTKLL
jgi:hypothetical protein